jgi:hypothetical protein
MDTVKNGTSQETTGKPGAATTPKNQVKCIYIHKLVALEWDIMRPEKIGSTLESFA